MKNASKIIDESVTSKLAKSKFTISKSPFVVFKIYTTIHLLSHQINTIILNDLQK